MAESESMSEYLCWEQTILDERRPFGNSLSNKLLAKIPIGVDQSLWSSCLGHAVAIGSESFCQPLYRMPLLFASLAPRRVRQDTCGAF